MEFVEREQQFAEIKKAWGEAARGQGRIVLVSGEAGIGKTSLIERFIAEVGNQARLLRGACDDLFSPQPLGPLIEIAVQIQSDLKRFLQSGADRLSFSAEIFVHLQKSLTPVIVVLEDLHWADEATLDVVKFLGRRIQNTKTLLILSYRDDEVSGDHLLRFLLGDFRAHSTVRIALPRLSQGAVDRLAQQTNRHIEGLYRVTGGNPFFVTEILASQAEGIPPSVRDAVLARFSRLSPAAKKIVELAALFPGAVEDWLIQEILHPDSTALDECVERGILRSAGDSLAFHHELARQSIEDSLPVGKSRDLHKKILAALQGKQGERAPQARLVHHAVRAGDEESTLRLALPAAQQASALGSHREAISLYTSLLRYRHRLGPETQADLLERLSYDNYLIDHIADAIQTRLQAMLIWKQLDRSDRIGDCNRWLSRLHWMAGNGKEALEYADQAIDILEDLPPGPELAMAYSTKSQLHMLAWEEGPAMEWGNRAVELAEKLGSVDIFVHAMTNVGSIETLQNDQTGTEKIVIALRTALEHEMHDHAARCYSNLVSNHIRTRRYREGRRWLEEGLDYTTARDLDSYTVYLRSWQAKMCLETGRWAEAEAYALEAIHLIQNQTISSLPAVIALGLLKVRQGDPSGEELLDQARALALSTGELQRQGPVAAARAEAAWSRLEPGQIAAVASAGYALAISRNEPWVSGELAYWMWQAGTPDIPLERLASPYANMIRGEWQLAAQEWEQIGCPFEQALSLAQGDEPAQIQALAIFEQLGAMPAAGWLRKQLKAQGLVGLPPEAGRPKQDPVGGLTQRELEVLKLIDLGLSNPAIAEKLTISIGTVKAHSGSIYSKLGVKNRVLALARARQLHIL